MSYTHPTDPLFELLDEVYDKYAALENWNAKPMDLEDLRQTLVRMHDALDSLMLQAVEESIG